MAGSSTTWAPPRRCSDRSTKSRLPLGSATPLLLPGGPDGARDAHPVWSDSKEEPAVAAVTPEGGPDRVT
jgi:hypothetical protein